MWYLFSSFLWDTALGTSFVGFGSAAYYLSDAIATRLLAKLATRTGYLPGIWIAIVSHTALYALLIVHSVAPVECVASGCAAGTAGSCWQLAANQPNVSTAPYPFDCATRGIGCANCTSYNAAYSFLDGIGQQCDVEAGWRQCEWLHGDAQTPRALGVVFLFVTTVLFAVGDAVWMGQAGSILQTLFNAGSGNQPSAMANLKLWQSLGIAAVYGVAQLCDVKLTAAACLGFLGVAATAILWAHHRIVDLDTGLPRRQAQQHRSAPLLSPHFAAWASAD